MPPLATTVECGLLQIAWVQGQGFQSHFLLPKSPADRVKYARRKQPFQDSVIFPPDVFTAMDYNVIAFGFNSSLFFLRNIDGDRVYFIKNTWAAELWI